jgi:hypothetical protein
MLKRVAEALTNENIDIYYVYATALDAQPNPMPAGPWIRAGALAGLVESRAPGTDDLLRELLEEHQSGLVRDQAAVRLARLSGLKHLSQVSLDGVRRQGETLQN